MGSRNPVKYSRLSNTHPRSPLLLGFSEHSLRRRTRYDYSFYCFLVPFSFVFLFHFSFLLCLRVGRVPTIFYPFLELFFGYEIWVLPLFFTTLIVEILFKFLKGMTFASPLSEIEGRGIWNVRRGDTIFYLFN